MLDRRVTEAMCCGTPVIALRSGGVTDQIKDGVTGFLCDALDEVREIIVSDKVSEIDPCECRRHVEENFSKEIMAKTIWDTLRRFLREKIEKIRGFPAGERFVKQNMHSEGTAGPFYAN